MKKTAVAGLRSFAHLSHGSPSPSSHRSGSGVQLCAPKSWKPANRVHSSNRIRTFEYLPVRALWNLGVRGQILHHNRKSAFFQSVSPAFRGGVSEAADKETSRQCCQRRPARRPADSAVRGSRQGDRPTVLSEAAGKEVSQQCCQKRPTRRPADSAFSVRPAGSSHKYCWLRKCN